MNIADAFAKLVDGSAAIARRACWHVDAYVFASVEVGPDGSPIVLLGRDDVVWSIPWAPHSVDIRAEDWETYE